MWWQVLAFPGANVTDSSTFWDCDARCFNFEVGQASDLVQRDRSNLNLRVPRDTLYTCDKMDLVQHRTYSNCTSYSLTLPSKQRHQLCTSQIYMDAQTHRHRAHSG